MTALPTYAIIADFRLCLLPYNDPFEMLTGDLFIRRSRLLCHPVLVHLVEKFVNARL